MMIPPPAQRCATHPCPAFAGRFFSKTVIQYPLPFSMLESTDNNSRSLGCWKYYLEATILLGSGASRDSCLVSQSVHGSENFPKPADNRLFILDCAMNNFCEVM